MRQIVFDTETTGLEPELGHRIIEIGAIELVNRRRTGRQFHRYLCPDRTIDPGAVQVHGLTTEFLSGQPRFGDIFDELREFVAMKIGALARPDDILFSADLPKTRSGKIMRRLLRDIAEGRALGDTTTLADPSVVASLKEQYEADES